MVFKMLLLYYKNGRGHNYRKQGQMPTLVEYLLILYRAVLPTPVWYLFFLNKEYGSFFSSLITGLYLTVKLTTVLWKVQLFFTAWRTLPLKEMYYGSFATSEQVKAVGDLCAICQEKTPERPFHYVVNTFCEDCVSEWSFSPPSSSLYLWGSYLSTQMHYFGYMVLFSLPPLTWLLIQ